MMRISLSNTRRRANAASAVGDGNRQGIALVEIIIAMVLLAIAVSSLAALVWSVSKSSTRTAGDAYKNGVLMQEVNRLEGIPYDSIPAGTSYVSVSAVPYPHTRVVTVSETVANLIKTVKVVITPSNPKYKPDTVSFIRTKARTTHVLCTDCPTS